MNSFPFLLARRYIFSGKNAVEVNVISWIAFLALGFVTACLIVILSVFSGLEDINLQYYSQVNPNIKISPSQGKIIQNSDEILPKIVATKGVEFASRVLEEKAFINYDNKEHIITLKGVDTQFNHIFGLDSMVKVGRPLEYKDDLLIGVGVSSRLSLYIDENQAVLLRVPKAGKGLISNQNEAFRQVEAYSSGIFYINEKYDQTVFSDLELAQQLLDYNPKQISSIEIKTKDEFDVDEVKVQLEKTLGNGFQIKTRREQDAAFLKMMNTENLIIYLIFILILAIASFNLAGTVAILMIDKRKNISTLKSLGLNGEMAKKTFFVTGCYISLYALIFGLITGSILAFMQQQFGLLMVSDFIAFPVKFTGFNYGLTLLSVMGIGVSVSWLVSRNVSLD